MGRAGPQHAPPVPLVMSQSAYGCSRARIRSRSGTPSRADTSAHCATAKSVDQSCGIAVPQQSISSRPRPLGAGFCDGQHRERAQRRERRSPARSTNSSTTSATQAWTRHAVRSAIRAAAGGGAPGGRERPGPAQDGLFQRPQA